MALWLICNDYFVPYFSYSTNKIGLLGKICKRQRGDLLPIRYKSTEYWKLLCLSRNNNQDKTGLGYLITINAQSSIGGFYDK